MTKKTIEILCHNVEYEYMDNFEGELNECDIEEITKFITEGYREGEIYTLDPDNQDLTHRGWWKRTTGI